MRHFKHAFVFLVFLLYAINLSKSNELSQSVNKWTVDTVQGGDWVYDATAIELTQLLSNNYAQITMLDKQWYNANGCVSIDYTLSVDFNANVPRLSGLVLFNGKSASYCEWYFIGLEFFSGHRLVVVRGNAPNEQETPLRDVPIAFVDEQDYTLSINVCNDNAFDISIDHELKMSYTDTGARGKKYTTLNNGYSGYIAIWSDVNIITRAKSLTVSGVRQTVTPLDASTSSNCVSLSPTRDPSKAPSPQPTDASTQSTKAPSVSASSHPSHAPTHNPSVSPSKTPSDSPTNHPSNGPTTSPTKQPSGAPTIGPSQSPVQTMDPTFYPSQSTPTENPTRVPIARSTAVTIATTSRSTTSVVATNAISSSEVLLIVLSIMAIIVLISCILVALIYILRTGDGNDSAKGTKPGQTQMSAVTGTETAKQERETVPDLPEEINNEMETKPQSHVQVKSRSQFSDDVTLMVDECVDCGKHTESMFALDGQRYCSDCRECYDDDADGMYQQQPTCTTEDATPIGDGVSVDQCVECGKDTEPLFKLDGLFYCRECKEIKECCEDDDSHSDGMYEPQPTTAVDGGEVEP